MGLDGPIFYWINQIRPLLLQNAASNKQSLAIHKSITDNK